MARMHSRKGGKSGSKKPLKGETPKWVKHNQKDTAKLVGALASAGKKPDEIGMILRDQHGIPDVRMTTKKNITGILRETSMAPDFPIDLEALLSRASQIQNHLSTHKKDFDAKRGLQLTESKIRRLAKYYKRKGKIPENWIYTPTGGK